MSELGIFDMVKMAYKVITYKLEQRRLQTNETAEVDTTYGPVKGVKRMTIYDDTYYSFEGIPFAKPPVGELRFRAPQPPEPWTEVKDCTAVRSKPLQGNLLFSKSGVVGSEDCLYLNVYSRNLYPEKPTPVMVWIYGGGFQIGEASRDLYSPEYFMKEDVIIISITYRLGALGFLSIDDPEVGIPGNAGLKDQVLGLKWAKENCSKFGGDPNNITVFGESAGGASTHLMAITNQTKGLFQKVILMSGSALSDWVSPPKDNWGYRLAEVIGYTGKKDDKSVFKFLSNAKGSDLVKGAAQILNKTEKQNRTLFVFGPTVEPYIGEDCVIPESPRLMMRNSWSNQLPMLVGGVAFEGLLFYPETRRRPKILQEVGTGQYLVPKELKLDSESDKCKELGQTILKTHFGDKECNMGTMFEYLDLLSVKHFWHSLHRTVLSRLEYSSAPTYLYRFDVDTKDFNQIRNLLCGKNVRGTCHGDDLSFCFYGSLAYKVAPESIEYKTIRRMTKMFTQFAATGNPNNDELGGVVFEEAKKSDDNSLKCLNISEEVQFIDLPERHKIAVWDGMYTKDMLY